MNKRVDAAFKMTFKNGLTDLTFVKMYYKYFNKIPYEISATNEKSVFYTNGTLQGVITRLQSVIAVRNQSREIAAPWHE